MTEIRYRRQISAESISIGIGIGAEIFFSETETFFFSIFFKFLHVFLLPKEM